MVALLLLAGWILMGCDDGGPTGGGDNPIHFADYYPLAVGYTWTYNECDAVGNILGTDTEEIVESHEFLPSGVIVYFTSYELGNYEGFAFKDDGFYSYEADDLDESNLEKVLDDPIEVGDVYTSSTGYVVELISKSANVTTPFGTFTSCLKFKSWDTGDEEDYDYNYFAEGVGSVKYETWTDGVLDDYRELVDYDVDSGGPSS